MAPESNEPVESRPPLIPPSVPAQPPRKETSLRQLLSILLSLFLGLFLADAIVSLMDDSLVLFFNIHFLDGIRGMLFTVCILISLAVYVAMALSPVISKRLFLPLVLFNPVALLVSFPAWIYFYSRAQQFSWFVSLIQVIYGVWMYRRIQGMWKWQWPVVRPELIQGPRFSWVNFFTFCLVTVGLALPGIVAYLVFCSALAVNHFSDGFVALRRVGFTVQVRKYVRDDGKSILLVPMAHIGEPEFYRSLSRSFPTNATILMEGVQDDKNLLTNHISYKRMASSLGLAQQQKEFRPSPVQMVMADIDVDQFTPTTIDFLNLVMLIHARGLTAQNLMLLMQSSGSPEFEDQIFDDILRKRNQHLLHAIEAQLPRSEELVVPWGAAHMPGIARDIQKLGFRLDSAHEFVAIRFHRRHVRRAD